MLTWPQPFLRPFRAAEEGRQNIGEQDYEVRQMEEFRCNDHDAELLMGCKAITRASLTGFAIEWKAVFE